jgi:hypothetical protein
MLRARLIICDQTSFKMKIANAANFFTPTGALKFLWDIQFLASGVETEPCRGTS